MGRVLVERPKAVIKTGGIVERHARIELCELSQRRQRHHHP